MSVVVKIQRPIGGDLSVGFMCYDQDRTFTTFLRGAAVERFMGREMFKGYFLAKIAKVAGSIEVEILRQVSERSW